MKFVSNWLDEARQIVTSPSEFYQNEDRRDGFGYPLKFAAFSLLIAGVLSAAKIGIYGVPGEASLSMPVTAGISLVSSVMGGLIGLVIGAAFIHVLVALLGGENGYAETLGSLGYASALTALGGVLGLFPVIGGLANALVGLYGIYVQAKGLEFFQDLSFGRSLVAILLPGVVLAIIVFGLMVTVFASMMALSGMPA
jgi:hypothetical protein